MPNKLPPRRWCPRTGTGAFPRHRKRAQPSPLLLGMHMCMFSPASLSIHRLPETAFPAQSSPVTSRGVCFCFISQRRRSEQSRIGLTKTPSTTSSGLPSIVTNSAQSPWLSPPSQLPPQDMKSLNQLPCTRHFPPPHSVRYPKSQLLQNTYAPLISNNRLDSDLSCSHPRHHPCLYQSPHNTTHQPSTVQRCREVICMTSTSSNSVAKGAFQISTHILCTTLCLGPLAFCRRCLTPPAPVLADLTNPGTRIG